jgi:hypothetical protein
MGDIFVESVAAETTQLLNQMKAEPPTVSWYAFMMYNSSFDSVFCIILKLPAG